LLTHLKTISKETIIYGIGNAAGSIVSFLLLPLYTKYLSPADYGYLTLFAVFQSIIEITAVFGLNSGLFRYFLMAKDKIEQKNVLNTCFWMQVLFIVFLGILAFPLANQFSKILFETSIFSKYISMVIATGLMSAFGSFIFSFMRAERKPMLFAVMQIGKVLLLALLNIYFVAILQRGYSGIIIGNLLTAIASALVIFAWFFRFIGGSFSFAFFKKNMAFISPIYVVNVFFFLLSLSDRFFLNHFLTPTEVGLYSFGNKIGSIVMIGVITPFSIAIVPYAMSIAKEENFKFIFSKIIKYFFTLLVFLSLVIFYFSREIVFLVSNESYMRATGVVGPILLSSIFYGLYYNLSIAIDIVEKTYLATIVVISGAVISIAVNYLTIPYLGIYGSTLASCASNITLFLLVYYFCQKNYRIHYEVGAFFKILGIISLYAAMYGIINKIELIGGFAILIKIMLCSLFPVVLKFCRVFDQNEIQFVKKYFTKIRNR
jgi:O-antigen/teichoic acid export membrane protein